MANLKLATDGDLDFSTGNLQIVTGTAEIAQKVSVRLKFFLGEWFLDQRLGIPYFQQVFIKNPQFSVLNNLFRGVVVNTPGIAEVQSFSLALNSATRTLTVTFLARASTGENINFNEEFVIA